jgi:hypothetical protein
LRHFLKYRLVLAYSGGSESDVQRRSKLLVIFAW